MNKSFIKQLTFILGGVLMIVGGLYFMLFGDLLVRSTSSWLFVGSILSLGSGVFTILSDIIKNKKKLFFIFRGIGVALAIGFIIFTFIYLGQDVAAIALEKALTKTVVIQRLNTTTIPSIIIAFLGVIAQGVSLAFNALFGIDE